MSFFSNLFSQNSSASSASSESELTQINEKLSAIQAQVDQIPTLIQKVEGIPTIRFEDRSQVVCETPSEFAKGQTYKEILEDKGVLRDQVTVTYENGNFETLPTDSTIEDHEDHGRPVRVETVIEAQNLG